MRITTENMLAGGLGLVVALFVIAGVLAWIAWMRRRGFWYFFGNHSAPLDLPAPGNWAKYRQD
jgi:hypothetical protein